MNQNAYREVSESRGCPTPAVEGSSIVHVFFFCQGVPGPLPLSAVERTVAAHTLDAAFAELFAGPTPAEKQLGLGTQLDPSIGYDFELVDDVLYFDIDGSIRDVELAMVTHGWVSQIQSVAKQFDEVQHFELYVDGVPFCEVVLEAACMDP